MAVSPRITQKIDSIRQQMSHIHIPSEKVDAWLNLSNQYFNLSQTDSIQYCLNQGFRIVENAPYAIGEYFLLSYQTELLDKNTLYDEAFQYAFKSMRKAESIGDRELIGDSNILLGLIYNDSGDPRLAIHYLKKGLNLLPFHSHQKHEISQRYHALLNMGQCYLKLKEYGPAVYYLRKAIQAAANQKDYRVLAIASCLLGNAYYDKEKYDLAGQQYKSGLQYALSINDWDAAVLFYPHLFHYYYRQKQYTRALAALRSGLQLVKQTPGRIATLPRKDFYIELVAIYRLLGNYSKALEAQRAVLEITEQINQQISSQQQHLHQLLDVQERTILLKDSERKIQQVLLQRNRQWNIVLSILLALLAVIFGVVYYGLRQRQKFERLQQQNRLFELEQQREIATLKAMIDGEEQERNRLANELHNGVGSLLVSARHSLERRNRLTTLSMDSESLKLIDNAYDEVRRIAHNLMPHALQSAGLTVALEQFCEMVDQSTQLQTTLQIYGLSERLEPSLELWLYRIVQELVSNILKHARATTALVQLSYANGLIHLTVEDNGQGFVVSEILQGHGFGLRQLTDRATYLHGTVHIESEPGSGTSIFIELPRHPLMLQIA